MFYLFVVHCIHTSDNIENWLWVYFACKHPKYILLHILKTQKHRYILTVCYYICTSSTYACTYACTYVSTYECMCACVCIKVEKSSI